MWFFFLFSNVSLALFRRWIISVRAPCASYMLSYLWWNVNCKWKWILYSPKCMLRSEVHVKKSYKMAHKINKNKLNLPKFWLLEAQKVLKQKKELCNVFFKCSKKSNKAEMRIFSPKPFSNVTWGSVVVSNQMT